MRTTILQALAALAAGAACGGEPATPTDSPAAEPEYLPCHLQLVGDSGTTFTLTQL